MAYHGRWQVNPHFDLRIPLLNIIHSKKYVQTIIDALPAHCLHLSTPVKAVKTLESGKLLLTTADGKSEEYDHVIMATHTDVTMAILREGGGVTEAEEKIIGGFQWNNNEAVVHSDTSVSSRSICRRNVFFDIFQLMPKAKKAWSCWNYITKSYVDENGVAKANHDAASL